MPRLKQVNALILREVSEILKRRIEFPIGTLVTVSEVDTSSTLGNANVYVSIIPKNFEKEILEILVEHIYDIQQELNHLIRMRHTPKIRFEIDHREERVAHIERIIDAEKKAYEN